MKIKNDKKFKSITWKKDHPEGKISGDPKVGVQIRKKIVRAFSLLSSIEPKNVIKVSRYEGWVQAINEELYQIEKNKTWELVSRPANKNVIGTTWIFQNTLNEDG